MTKLTCPYTQYKTALHHECVAFGESQQTFLLQFFFRHVVWYRHRRGYAWWHPCRDPSVGEGSCHGALLLKTQTPHKDLERALTFHVFTAFRLSECMSSRSQNRTITFAFLHVDVKLCIT